MATRSTWVSCLFTLFEAQAQCSGCFLHASVTRPYPDGGCRYRAVVFGWDRRCRGSGSWVAKHQANPEQPYYYCLPDEGNALRRPAPGSQMQHTPMQPMPWQCLRSLLFLHCCSAAGSEHTCPVAEKLSIGCYLHAVPNTPRLLPATEVCAAVYSHIHCISSSRLRSHCEVLDRAATPGRSLLLDVTKQSACSFGPSLLMRHQRRWRSKVRAADPASAGLVVCNGLGPDAARAGGARRRLPACVRQPEEHAVRGPGRDH